jgi:hypothetical protein
MNVELFWHMDKSIIAPENCSDFGYNSVVEFQSLNFEYNTLEGLESPLSYG